MQLVLTVDLCSQIKFLESGELSCWAAIGWLEKLQQAG
jgi:hypothetical protein